MKKTSFKLVGLAAAFAIIASLGAGCTGGGGDEVVAPKSGAGATDNPSVGQPVGADSAGGESPSGVGATKGSAPAADPNGRGSR